MFFKQAALLSASQLGSLRSAIEKAGHFISQISKIFCFLFSKIILYLETMVHDDERALLSFLFLDQINNYKHKETDRVGKSHSK